MLRKKRFIFLVIMLLTLFLVSCSNTEATANEQEVTENGSMAQPILTLENQEKGVLVKWEEIPGAEGYYVYSKVKGDKFKGIATIKDPKTVEYLDLEAPSGIDYYYTVRAYKGEEKSAYESYKIKTAVWEPEVKVVYKAPDMQVSWTQIDGCEGYIVYRKEEGGKYEPIETIEDATILSYIDEATTPGTVYLYTVRAYMGKEKSTYTGVTKAALAQPVVEVNNTEEGVALKWQQVEGAEGYYVYRKEEDSKYEIIETLQSVEKTEYLDTNMQVGKNYSYTVRAYLGEHKSSYSGVDIATDLGRVEITLESSKSGVKIAWNEISMSEGYYIYRKQEGESEYSLRDTVTDASVTEYLDEQVENGDAYNYYVRAFFGDELSSYSGATIKYKK